MERVKLDSTLFRNFFRSYRTEGTEDQSLINRYLDELVGKNLPKTTFLKHTQSLIKPSILIDNRYSISEAIGRGAYGKVFKVMDKQEKKYRAMKLLNNATDKDKYFSRREFDCLFKINAWDVEDESYIVKMTGAFYTGVHLGIVFELLGPTVYDILTLGGQDNVFQMQQVKTINYQILKAADFLHSRGLIHHDIKTNNLAFVSGAFDKDDEGKLVMTNASIRLIDLGSCTEAEPKGRVITATTVQYRSPEMSFGTGWCRESDIWSAGCTFFEVYNGFLLFHCDSEIEKYYMIESVLQAKLPINMALLDGKPRFECFDVRGTLIFNEQTQKMREKSLPLDSYKRIIGDADTNKLFDLLRRMLVINPHKRISSKAALRHPFFEGVQVPPQ